MNRKPVLITGCSSGIGRCLARGLHQRGYRVFASARKAKDVAELESEGLESLQLDLDDSASITAAVDSVMKRTGNLLYALINNGAYAQPGAIEDLTRDTLRRQFETNVLGTQELTNRVLPVMRNQGQGRIIQISSIFGFIAFAYRGAYIASKYALEGLSDTLRLELRDTDIRVSLIEPGPIVSRIRDNAYKAFLANIDFRNSVHHRQYAAMIKRLEGKTGNMPFTQPPEAVLTRVIHALESRRPRIRYAVTFPSYLFTVLRRLLPSRWLDSTLASAGKEGGR